MKPLWALMCVHKPPTWGSCHALPVTHHCQTSSLPPSIHHLCLRTSTSIIPACMDSVTQVTSGCSCYMPLLGSICILFALSFAFLLPCGGEDSFSRGISRELKAGGGKAVTEIICYCQHDSFCLMSYCIQYNQGIWTTPVGYSLTGIN
jgi:hypothetical protein